METEFRLTVNGAEFSVTCGPDTMLLDVLGDDLGLAGPKFGCGMGLCGTCFALIEGRVRSSCDLPVSAVADPVTTAEGLAGDGALHRVQQAFIDEQAAQCGYCTCGMVMAAVGLLRERPGPDRAGGARGSRRQSVPLRRAAGSSARCGRRLGAAVASTSPFQADWESPRRLCARLTEDGVGAWATAGRERPRLPATIGPYV